MNKRSNAGVLTQLILQKKRKQTLLSIFKSVSAAFLGVQSDKNRQDDFNNGKISHFIIVGIVCTAVLIALLIAIVSMVLPSS